MLLRFRISFESDKVITLYSRVPKNKAVRRFDHLLMNRGVWVRIVRPYKALFANEKEQQISFSYKLLMKLINILLFIESPYIFADVP